jgi:hypothetical protein
VPGHEGGSLLRRNMKAFHTRPPSPGDTVFIMITTEIGSKLRQIVNEQAPKLLAIPEARTTASRAPGKWSAKQIIGHLIDSASNNHQRFVRARFTDDLVFLRYEQEAWVDVQGYADAEWPSLVSLWREFNLHIARVIERTPAEEAERPRTRHNLDQIGMEKVSTDHAVTLAYFMNDYVVHLQHHLEQVWATCSS